MIPASLEVPLFLRRLRPLLPVVEELARARVRRHYAIRRALRHVAEAVRDIRSVVHWTARAAVCRWLILLFWTFFWIGHGLARIGFGRVVCRFAKVRDVR